MNLRTFVAATFAFAGLGLCAAGCGGGTSVSGTINKKSFDAMEAISGNVNLDSGSADSGSAGVVLISNQAGTCDMFATGKIRKNMKLLQIGLGALDFGSGKAVAPKEPGSFAVFDPNSGKAPTSTTLAFVLYIESDEACKSVGEPLLGSSGEITVDSVDGGVYAGSGDVTLSNGDHITFDFDSTACANFTSLKLEGSGGMMSTCN